MNSDLTAYEHKNKLKELKVLLSALAEHQTYTHQLQRLEHVEPVQKPKDSQLILWNLPPILVSVTIAMSSIFFLPYVLMLPLIFGSFVFLISYLQKTETAYNQNVYAYNDYQNNFAARTNLQHMIKIEKSHDLDLLKDQIIKATQQLSPTQKETIAPFIHRLYEIKKSSLYTENIRPDNFEHYTQSLLKIVEMGSYYPHLDQVEKDDFHYLVDSLRRNLETQDQAPQKLLAQM